MSDLHDATRLGVASDIVLLAQRLEAIADGSTSSHWPHGPGSDHFRFADTPDEDWWTNRSHCSHQDAQQRAMRFEDLTQEQTRLSELWSAMSSQHGDKGHKAGRIRERRAE